MFWGTRPTCGRGRAGRASRGSTPPPPRPPARRTPGTRGSSERTMQRPAAHEPPVSRRQHAAAAASRGHSPHDWRMRLDKVPLPLECPWLSTVVGLHGDQQSDVVKIQGPAAAEVRACGGGREGPCGARGVVPHSTARGGASSRDPAVWLGSPASREGRLSEHLPGQH